MTFSNRKPLSMQKNNNYSLKIAVKLKIFHLRRLPAAHFLSAKPQSGTGKKISRFHWSEAWSPQAKFQISTSFFDSLILRLSQVFAGEGITQVLMILHDYSCFKKLFSVLCNNQSERGEKKKFPFDDNHNSGILSQRKKRRRVWTDVTVSWSKCWSEILRELGWNNYLCCGCSVSTMITYLKKLETLYFF